MTHLFFSYLSRLNHVPIDPIPPFPSTLHLFIHLQPAGNFPIDSHSLELLPQSPSTRTLIINYQNLQASQPSKHNKLPTIRRSSQRSGCWRIQQTPSSSSLPPSHAVTSPILTASETCLPTRISHTLITALACVSVLVCE